MEKIKKTILIVEDEAVIAENLRMVLEDNGYTVSGVEASVNRALESIARRRPFLVLVDIFLTGALSGIQLAHALNEQNIPFVYVSANCDQRTLDAAKATSPSGFLVKPFREKDLLVTLDIALYHYEQTRQLNASKAPRSNKLTAKEQIKTTPGRPSNAFESIIGESAAIQTVFHMVEQVATMSTSVLVLGESGTGKEGIAKAIHELSPRKNKPFVKINCAALPPQLIESELFGHEKWAFTGAHERKIGKFERANGGTIFLDEVGEMSLDLQVKLLRVLQEREIERVGGDGPIAIDVRVIAATNRNLEQMLAASTFRLDLYYRLNVFPILMPALRDRKEDIPLLANHFANLYAQIAGKKLLTFSNAAVTQLTDYPWPGNIRELQNIIERTVLLTRDNVLKRIELPPLTAQNDFSSPSPEPSHGQKISDIERTHILEVLKKCRNKMTGPGGAAEFLSLPPSTLYSKMKKLGINKVELDN